MTVSVAKVLCGVCKVNEKKYKCPACLLPYCSIECFKTHKVTCSTLSNSPEDEEGNLGHRVSVEPDTSARDTEPEQAFLFATPNTVPLDKLQLLAQSDKLKNLLTNKHLRDFLMFLDSTEDKAMLMRKAMREPLFVEFVDVCLETVNPDRNSTNFTDEQLLQAIKDHAEEEDLNVS